MTVFGLQWTQATDAYVRPAGTALTHLSVTSPTNAETLAAVAQASTYAPWSGMRRCNLWDDGTVTAYYGDRCYTDTDVANMGQAMVQIPKFWYTTDHGGGVYKWYISTDGDAADLPAGADHQWYVHRAFLRDYPTNPAKDYIYLGAYEGYLNGAKLESKSGTAVTGNLTLAQFRTAAQLRAGVANKWECNDFLAHNAAQWLYLLEYGGFNSQALIGSGITNDAAAHITGETAAHGNNTYGTTANATTAMSYRGIENLYGNITQLTDGINIHADKKVWIADHDFVSCITGDTSTGFAHPYSDTSLTVVYADYAADITTSATYDYPFISATDGGSATTKLCDGSNVAAAAANYIGGVSGGYAFTTQAGVFYFITRIPTYTAATFGARLMYIG